MNVTITATGFQNSLPSVGAGLATCSPLGVGSLMEHRDAGWSYGIRVSPGRCSNGHTASLRATRRTDLPMSGRGRSCLRCKRRPVGGPSLRRSWSYWTDRPRRASWEDRTTRADGRWRTRTERSGGLLSLQLAGRPRVQPGDHYHDKAERRSWEQVLPLLHSVIVAGLTHRWGKPRHSAAQGSADDRGR
jgi:hypothetical protein